MTKILGSVLTAQDLPEAELCAARLDGELYRLGTGFCLIDELEDSVRRAHALAIMLPARMIAEQRTVAWVLGLVDALPRPLELCTRSDARQRSPWPSETNVREVVIADDELVSLGGLTMTSPLRTAIDLARFSEPFEDAERTIIRGLASGASGATGFSLAEATMTIGERRNLPLKRRAIERLASSLR